MAATNAQLLDLIIRPILSEKTVAQAEGEKQYTFEVRKGVNKVELAKAVELAFPGRKVTAVRLINIPSRRKRFGKRVGHTPIRRKAVFSVTGEPIELFTGV